MSEHRTKRLKLKSQPEEQTGFYINILKQRLKLIAIHKAYFFS